MISFAVTISLAKIRKKLGNTNGKHNKIAKMTMCKV